MKHLLAFSSQQQNLWRAFITSWWLNHAICQHFFWQQDTVFLYGMICISPVQSEPCRFWGINGKRKDWLCIVVQKCYLGNTLDPLLVAVWIISAKQINTLRFWVEFKGKVIPVIHKEIMSETAEKILNYNFCFKIQNFSRLNFLILLQGNVSSSINPNQPHVDPRLAPD